MRRVSPVSMVRRLLAVAVLGAVATPASAAVGRTAGAHSVSPSGEANYTVPIFTPPGTHGMTPQLSLSYGHRIGGEWMGQGWGVSGLSEISRCAKTWAQDGQARSVQLDAYDRFCLDGQQLKVDVGTYGANGTTYRTEIEGYARITSYGSAGSGPAYFVVERKDGTIYEYGSSADSRIESLGSASVRAWAVSVARDRTDNRITFGYTEDATLGSYRIDNVQYTANPNQGIPAAYRVQFTYETQPTSEIESSFLAGSGIKDVTRMTRVEVTYNSAIVRRYNIAYEASLSSASHSRLSTVTECAGATGTDCLSPVTFTYQNGTPGIGSPSSTGLTATSPTSIIAMDVNGDGKVDLVYPSSAYSGNWVVAFANTSGGYGTPVNSGISGSLGAIPIDYNADGLEDLLLINSGVWYVALGSTTGLGTPTSTGIAVMSGLVNAAAFDTNGDGLDDLVEATSNAVQARTRAWGATFGTASYLISPLSSGSYLGVYFYTNGIRSRYRMPDFNGDGRRDFLATICDLNTSTWECTNTDEAVISGGGVWYLGSSPSIDAQVMADFNGDGFTDCAVIFPGYSNWYYRFSTGTGFTGWVVGASTTGQLTQQAVALDWDSDGYEDLLVPSTGGIWQLMRTTGEALQAPVSTGISSGTVSAAALIDANGDGLVDVITANASGGMSVSLHSGVAPDFLASVTDGYNNTISFSYASIAQGAYTKAADGVYPHIDTQAPLQVVNQITAPDGNGSTYTVSYWYYYGRVNPQGRGFEGFYAQNLYDSRTGIRDYRYFVREFPYSGLQFEHDLYQSNWRMMESNVGVTISAHELGTSYEKRYFPYIQFGYQRQYEVEGLNDGALLRTTEHTNIVDAATGTSTDVRDNIIESATGNGIYGGATWYRQTLIPTLYTDTTNWCIGRPQTTQQVQNHSLTYGTQQTRTTSATWNATYCRPSQTQLEPNDATWRVTTDIGYDGFGNVNSETVTGVGMAARITTTSWGGNGQFPVSVTNPLSEISQRAWNAAIGQPSSETDPNGLQVSWQYDNFGRRTREARPDNTATDTEYYYCASGCDSRIRMYQIQRLRNTANGEIRNDLLYFDSYDRPLYEYRLAFNGTNYTITDRGYDALGRVSYEKFPYYNGGAPSYYQSVTYDLIGRPISTSRPKSESDTTPVVATISYRGLTTVETDPLGKVKTTIRNAAGETIRSIDHSGYYQQFAFDAFGNAKEVKDSYGTTLQSATFNIRGLRTASTDVDMGSWGYAYNALGEMTSHTDANGLTTSYGFDALSRMTSRSEPNAGGTVTKSWIWGNSAANKNIGKLQQAAISGAGVTTYNENYSYDVYGRPTRAIYYDGANYHQFDTTYNSTTGFLESVQYPVSTGTYRHQVVYEYQYGIVKKVRDVGNTVTYWQANTQDARGNVTDESLGNGLKTTRTFDGVTGLIGYIRTGPGGGTARQNLNYTWDTVGNLLTRNDANQSITEAFVYDNLHRLDYSTLGGSTNLDLTYDAYGNITNKSDLGAYTYHATKIHAVATAGSWTYGYDANGNVTSKNGAAITWFASNLPKSISNGTYSSQFEYGADGNYWKQTATYSNGTETTCYLGNLLEVVQGAVTSWRHNIQVNGRTVAIYSRGSNGTNVTQYLLRDHLDSVDAVTDSAGAVFVAESFAAYGGRRGTNWTGVPSAADMTNIGNATRRGYTNHTMLDNIGLIHMNGRVFDPALGRFLSADPYVQSPGNTQSWNRYSYVMNNPLSYTDPSGYWSLKKFLKKWWKPIVAIAAGALTFGYLAPAASQWLATSTCLAPGAITAGGAAIGAGVASGVTTAIMGGSARDVLRSAVFAAATAYASFRVTDWLARRPDSNGNYAGLYQNNPTDPTRPYLVDDFTTIPDGSMLSINGMKNPIELAARNAVSQTGSESAYFYYNPSHGFGWDLFESAIQKLAPTSAMGSDLANVLGATNGRWAAIVAHSQGSLILANAVNTLQARGLTLSASPLVATNGAAGNRWLLGQHLRRIGVYGAVSGGDHGLDIVGNVIGLNAWYNPFRVAGSIAASPLLFTGASPHSSYHY